MDVSSSPSADNPSERGADVSRTALLATGLFSALVVLFFGWDLALGRRLLFSNDMQYSDFWHLHYPLKHFYAEALAEGRLAQWCHLLGSGVPLHAVGEAGMLYPPNLVLFFLLPLPLATNLSILGHVVLAGVLATSLARCLGASRSGALLAGLTFAFSAFFVGHARHLNLLAVAAWMPGILLFMERYWRRRLGFDLCGLAVVGGLSLLAGHPNLAYNHALIAAGYAIYLSLRSPSSPGSDKGDGASSSVRFFASSSVRFLLAMGLAVVLALALAAPQLLPSLQLHRQGPRQSGLSYEYATQFDLHPAYLRTWLQPDAFGRPDRFDAESGGGLGSGFRGAPGQTNLYWEVVPYLGILPLLLTAVILVVGRRRRHVQALVVMALLSMALAMGRHVGIGELLHAVLPGYDLFRFHPRFQLYAVLSVSVLGGLGLSELEASVGRRSKGLSLVIVASLLVVAGADLFVHLGDHNSSIEAQAWSGRPDSLIGLNGSDQVPAQRVLSFDPQQEVFLRGYLRAGGWSRGATAYEPARQLARDNYNLLFGVPQVEFYLPLYPQRARAVTESLYMTNSLTGRSERIHTGLATLFNVGTVLASERESLLGLKSSRGFPAPDRPALERVVRYSLPGALPRAFLVPSARVVTGAGHDDDFLPAEQMEALLAVTSPDFDPRAEVVIDRARGEELPQNTKGSPNPGSVRIRSYEAERVVLDVDATESAWLFLSDTWYPGWKARIDGQSATIFPANVAGRALWVPQGKHEVDFVFESGPLRLGSLLALLASLLLVLIGVRFRRQILD